MEIIIIVMFFIQLVLAFFAIKYKKTSTALRNILKNLNKKRNNALILVEELRRKKNKLEELVDSIRHEQEEQFESRVSFFKLQDEKNLRVKIIEMEEDYQDKIIELKTEIIKLKEIIADEEK